MKKMPIMPTKHNNFFVGMPILVLILNMSFSCAKNSSDIHALFVLRDSLAQRQDLIPNWFDISIHPCSWYGVLCVGQDVNHIDLSNLEFNIPFPNSFVKFRSLELLNISNCGFSGQIPSNIDNLQKLEYLDFGGNQLSGVLPSTIFNLTVLKDLTLKSNTFNGSLMPSIGKLTELTRLSLCGNFLSGSLPSSIKNLKNLQYLDLSLNSLGGHLSSSLGHLSNLLYLDLSRNQFTGSIFKEIENLANLLSLDFSSNSLTGPMPPEIGRLTSLESLWLRSTGLSGVIPHEIGNLVQLKEISLQNCKLTGKIPQEMSKLQSLISLDISQNSFEGGLPAGVGKLKNLSILMAANAGLSGHIPAEIGSCSGLQTLDLSFNSLSGNLPESLASLENMIGFMVDGNQLSGSIPSWISNWKKATSICLTKNHFNGSLPPLVIDSLATFSADANELSGEIPAQICNGKSLSALSLAENNLTGTIKNTFKECTSLTDLTLEGNKLHGEIPTYLSDLPLITLRLSENNFSGTIPYKLCESSTLLELRVSNNLLTGHLLENIGQLVSLQRLVLDNNQLKGFIPKSIGKLKNLTNLSLHGNRFSGEIPSELFNCDNLVALDLGSNNLSGAIPKAISQLKSLDNLVLSNNQLSAEIPPQICSGFQMLALPDSVFTQHYGVLDLSNNELVGQIPREIGDCVVVKELRLQGNKLNGSIPLVLTHLLNLTVIDLSYNSLTGPVLPSPFSMEKLQGLFLSNNQFSGPIPDDLGSMLPSLVKFNISHNHLMGDFPSSILDINSLAEVDISDNNLHGSIRLHSEAIRGTGSLITLNASNNLFSGSINDGGLSNLTTLAILDLHNNRLSGALPSSLSNLSTLTYLDVSNNFFEDAIPCGICTMISISFVNFSGNKFKKHVPEDCPAINLCSNIYVDSTPFITHHSPSTTSSQAYIWGVILGTMTVLLVFTCGILKWRRWRHKFASLNHRAEKSVLTESSSTDGLLNKKLKEPLSINIATFEHALLRLTLADILKATENFSMLHIIGDGGFGTVYKAALPEKMVAVKRLHGSGHFQGDREFVAEMETIGKVKHHNLVPLLGYCVFNDERFLIYEYMENGSLDLWLRNHSDVVEVLQWPVRFKICLGSARALAFLHHGFVPHIIHRDMKSSNILLDKEFEPRVSDFGLARIISACESHISTDLAGTFGYIPPEYGQVMKATAKGDVYSFGVIVLELLTGKPPVGQDELEGGGNLVGWVRWMVDKGKVDEVFDASLKAVDQWKKQMLPVLAVAMSCTSDEPWKRPSMLEVVKLLKDIKMMGGEDVA